MPALWSNGEFEISSEPFGGRSSLPGGGRIQPNDPRIPPPAADLTVWGDTGLVTVSGQPITTESKVEDDVPKKIGIYATRGDEFTISVLDDDNDPVEGGSFRYSAAMIVEKIKPMLEAAGHKCVDYSAGSLHEAASDGKVRPMRARKAASE
jgi:hypothetical protein